MKEGKGLPRVRQKRLAKSLKENDLTRRSRGGVNSSGSRAGPSYRNQFQEKNDHWLSNYVKEGILTSKNGGKEIYFVHEGNKTTGGSPDHRGEGVRAA